MRAVLIILAIWAAGLGAAAQFGKISILFHDLERHYAGAGPLGIGLMVSIVGIVGLVFGTSAGATLALIVGMDDIGAGGSGGDRGQVSSDPVHRDGQRHGAGCDHATIRPDDAERIDGVADGGQTAGH